MWFLVPLLVLVVLAVALDYLRLGSPEMRLRELVQFGLVAPLPGSVAGFTIGAWCRSTTWVRHLLLAIVAGSVWAAYVVVLIWYSSGYSVYEVSRAAKYTAAIAAATVPITLLLASTMRLWFQRRP